MHTHLIKSTLWLMGIMVTLAIWVVNAEPLVSEPYGHIEYTLNGNENFEAQVITVTGDDGTVITILDRNLWATGAGVGCEFDCTNEDSTYWYGYPYSTQYHGSKVCSQDKYRYFLHAIYLHSYPAIVASALDELLSMRKQGEKLWSQ